MVTKKYLHEKVYEDLKNKIMNKHYVTDSLLPTEYELTEIYNVSRHTIRKAMDRLNHEGFIRKVKGTGTFVNDLKTDYSLSNMASFSEIIHSQDGEPNSIVLSARLETVSLKILEKLHLKPKDKVYVIKRIRQAGGVSLCYEVTYISPVLCPDIDKYLTHKTSLYDLYENKYGLKLHEGIYRLEATIASKKVAKILDIPKNSSILFMRALITLTNNKPLYYVEADYVGSRYVFTTQLKR